METKRFHKLKMGAPIVYTDRGVHTTCTKVDWYFDNKDWAPVPHGIADSIYRETGVEVDGYVILPSEDAIGFWCKRSDVVVEDLEFYDNTETGLAIQDALKQTDWYDG